MVSLFLWMTYFTEHNTLQFHPCCYKRPDFILSHCQAVFHCVYKPHLLYPFVTDGHLDSFHNLTIVESDAINIGVQVPLCISTPVSLG